MYRAMLLLLLPGFAVGAEVPSWKTDYSKARKEAAEEQRPLAVVLGSGPQGWQKMGRDGGIGTTALALLADKYTPVYVDVSSAGGKRMAQAFEMPRGSGIVLSDRTGKLQAFRHEGDLTNRNLVKYLERYADPDRVVTSTESNPSEGASVKRVGKKKASVETGVPYCPTCQGCANGQCGRRR